MHILHISGTWVGEEAGGEQSLLVARAIRLMSNKWTGKVEFRRLKHGQPLDNIYDVKGEKNKIHRTVTWALQASEAL